MPSEAEFEARVRRIEGELAAGRFADAANLARQLRDWTRAQFGANHPFAARADDLLRRAEAGPLRSGDAPRSVQRHITVRYYTRVRPGTPYPMLVLISSRPISDAELERAVRQADQDKATLSTQHPADILPLLAGCTVSPPKHVVAVGPEIAEARFEIVANGAGQVPRACVWVQQRGETVANIPLEVKATRTVPMILWGVLAVFVPAVLKVFELDLEKTIGDGGSNWWAFLGQLVQVLPWWSYGLILGAIAVLTWWRSRPRSTTFFDVTMLDGPDLDTDQTYQDAREAFARGDSVRGLALLDELARAAPDFQPGWLLAGDWFFEQRQLREALNRYRAGLQLGPSTARRYAQAARSAADARELDLALTWVDAGLAASDGPTLRAVLLFNRACYLARKGENDEAMRMLTQAVAAGLPDPSVLQTDPDMQLLRPHDDFRKLVN